MKGTIRRKIEGKWWRLDLANSSCLVDARFLSALIFAYLRTDASCLFSGAFFSD